MHHVVSMYLAMRPSSAERPAASISPPPAAAAPARERTRVAGPCTLKTGACEQLFLTSRLPLCHACTILCTLEKASCAGLVESLLVQVLSAHGTGKSVKCIADAHAQQHETPAIQHLRLLALLTMYYNLGGP